MTYETLNPPYHLGMEFGANYVAGWGTLALINAALAQSQGRSRLGWFLVSLLIGPIATLAMVLTDKPGVKN